jgi:hypothetical protein
MTASQMDTNLTLDSDGILYITVVVDVAWSKRSYKSNYNALSSAGSIHEAKIK